MDTSFRKLSRPTKHDPVLMLQSPAMRYSQEGRALYLFRCIIGRRGAPKWEHVCFVEMMLLAEDEQRAAMTRSHDSYCTIIVAMVAASSMLPPCQ